VKAPHEVRPQQQGPGVEKSSLQQGTTSKEAWEDYLEAGVEWSGLHQCLACQARGNSNLPLCPFLRHRMGGS